MAKPIRVGELQFPTKKALTEYVQSILAKYESRSYLDSHDFTFVSQLLERHPNAATKIGCGIQAIKVDVPREWAKTRNAYKCFWITRKDGSCVDFSYRECVSASTPKAKFYEACRQAVVEQISAFRKQYVAQKLRSGQDFVMYVGQVALDVDHVIPFVELAEAFIQSHGIDVSSVQYKPATTAGRQEFADLSLTASWQRFHAEKAELQILPHTENLRKARKAAGAIPESMAQQSRGNR